MREALRIAREREPGLAIDGELQLDAAIIPAVAARKAPGEELVAGRANILVFPDLNAGNIAYKCVQRFAKADAFGPFFLGLTKTASDLSRGSSVTDVLGVITMASVHAHHLKQTDGWLRPGRRRRPGRERVRGHEGAGAQLGQLVHQVRAARLGDGDGPGTRAISAVSARKTASATTAGRSS